jgi:hypothetical protein
MKTNSFSKILWCLGVPINAKWELNGLPLDKLVL